MRKGWEPRPARHDDLVAFLLDHIDKILLLARPMKLELNLS